MKNIGELLAAIVSHIEVTNDHFYGQVVRFDGCKTPFVFTTYGAVVEVSPIGISREYNFMVFSFNDAGAPYLGRALIAGDYYRVDVQDKRQGYVTLDTLRNKDMIWV